MARTLRAEASTEARIRILEAALEAFSQNGYDGAKTRDIAARADVTLGLLQYYYGSKPKLWKAAVDLAFGELSRGLHGLLADPTPIDERERLRGLIHAHVRFVASNPEFVRLMHEEGKRRGPRMRWLVDRHTKPLFDKLLPLIARCQEKGMLLAGVDPVHFVYILVGAVDAIFHQSEECKRVSGLDPMDEAEVAAHARAIQSLFVGPTNQEPLT